MRAPAPRIPPDPRARPPTGKRRNRSSTQGFKRFAQSGTPAGSILPRSSRARGPRTLEEQPPSPERCRHAYCNRLGEACRSRASSVRRRRGLREPSRDCAAPSAGRPNDCSTLLGDPPLRFALWNGDSVTHCSAPAATLRMNSRRVLLGLLANPQLRFGEAYTDGGLEIEGDLGRVLELLFEAPDHSSRLWDTLLRWRQRLARHSLRRARRDVRSHYDLGNDFYALWLDRQMVYTCAYFPTPQATLEEAQLAKIDHVCRKLRLRPGERVVEAGCGWGSLALHMARHYGVSVRPSTSRASRSSTRASAPAARGSPTGSSSWPTTTATIRGRYDAFVSVGMLEHVGRVSLPRARQRDRRLSDQPGPRPAAFDRAQPAARDEPLDRAADLPGRLLPTLREMLLVLEPRGLCMLDVENLRLHYARTLEHWLERFEKHAGAIERRFDASFVRTWRLYLAGSIAAFRCGSLQLFQVLFARPELPRPPGRARTSTPHRRRGRRRKRGPLRRPDRRRRPRRLVLRLDAPALGSGRPDPRPEALSARQGLRGLDHAGRGDGARDRARGVPEGAHPPADPRLPGRRGRRAQRPASTSSAW